MSAKFVTVLAAAQEVDVRIVDDGRGGLGLRDLIVPIGPLVAALVGGLGGVLIGGRMNRTTLGTLEIERAQREDAREKDRTEREDKLDEARADRERALELDRERRAIDAQKRLAVGALRVQIGRFDTARLALGVLMQNNSFIPRMLEMRARADDVHLMATWMSHDNWRAVQKADAALDHMATMVSETDDLSPRTRGNLGQIYELAGDALYAVQEEITRLLEETGDPAAGTPWPSIPEYLNEPDGEEGEIDKPDEPQ